MQSILNGVIQGLLFGVMGLAFSLVYSTTHTFHIALGAIYALAPYTLLACIQAGTGWASGIIIALAISAAVGLLCEEALHWPFLRKTSPPEVHMIGSLGMFLVLIQIIALIWGNDTQVLRAGVDEIFTMADIRLAWSQLMGGAMAIIIMMGFFFWLRQSDLGLQFRAMADNPVLLSLLGRNIRNLRRMVFMVSACMAGLAALATAYDVGFDPHGGMQAVLVGVVATIMGGRGSLFGAALAGLLLGILRSQVVWYFSTQWEDAATFFILVLILFFRPHGLLGRAFRLEEKV